MAIKVNLRHLEAHELVLSGQLSVEDLDIDNRDEVIQLKEPLEYNLEVEKLEDAMLVHGDLHLPLDCQCVRCLKPFRYDLELKDWTAHVPLEGEEAAPVVSDMVDLTPTVREDILLEFPQHPLCKPECPGLPKMAEGKKKKAGRPGKAESGSSTWSELNKLKF